MGQACVDGTGLGSDLSYHKGAIAFRQQNPQRCGRQAVSSIPNPPVAAHANRAIRSSSHALSLASKLYLH